jgi:hypothetical protein
MTLFILLGNFNHKYELYLCPHLSSDRSDQIDQVVRNVSPGQGPEPIIRQSSYQESWHQVKELSYLKYPQVGEKFMDWLYNSIGGEELHD